jgi:protein O-GlcNAc transferase
VYLELRRPDLAIEALSKAVDLDPRLADAQFHLGTAYAESGRWEEAVGAYRKALALPTLAIPDFVHQNLGLALYHLKRYAEAESSLRFALSLDPKLQAAYYNLGLVLIAENRPAEARVAFRQARQLAPDTPFGQAARERLKSLGDGG